MKIKLTDTSSNLSVNTNISIPLKFAEKGLKGYNTEFRYNTSNDSLESRLRKEIDWTSITTVATDVNGYTGSVVLNTDDVSEGTTNLYYTDTRVRNAISVSGDLSYDASTGTISFNETYSTPSELLTALKTVDGSGSGLNADLLDGQEGSYYLDYTNFTNLPSPTITLAGDASGSITLSQLTGGTLDVTVIDGSHNHTSGDITDFNEAVADQVGTMVTSNTENGIGVTYNDVDNTLDFVLNPEWIHDNVIAQLVTGNTEYGISVTYDDANNSLNYEVTLSPFSTDDLSEGASNLYYTTARVNSDIDTRVDKDFVDALNVDADTLDGEHGSFYQDASNLNAGTLLDARIAESNVTQHEAAIDHDALTNFVANEHIDHSGILINAGTALTGGGDLTFSRTINYSGSLSDQSDANVATPSAGQILLYHATNSQFENANITAGTGISKTEGDASLTLSADEANINHDNLSGFVANEHIDHSTISISAGTGLSGGGTIDNNVSLAVDLNQLTTETTIESIDYIAMVDATDNGSSKITFANFESVLNHDNLSGFVVNEHIDHSNVTVTGGTGLSGGGDLTASRIINLDANIDHINDVSNTTPTNRDVLVYDGVTDNQYENRALEADDIQSGTFNDARIAESNVTQHEAAITITESQISDLQDYALVGHTHPSSDITDFTEASQDVVGGMVSTNNETGISVTYDDTNGKLDFVVSLSPFSTDDLSEGSSNLYYTTTRVNSDIDTRVDKAFVDALNVDADTLDGNHSSYYLDFNNFTNLPDPVITAGGDLSGSVELTNLSSATFNLTIETNAVEESMLTQSLQEKVNARPQSNLDATTDPTVNDDSDSGYEYGSVWINTSSHEAFRCVDPTVGNAVWIETTLEVGELGSMATQDSNSVSITGGSISGTSIDLNSREVEFGEIRAISENEILGRQTSGSGDIETLTATQVRSIINVENGATADQTASEIRSLVDSANDSNVYTDSEKQLLADLELFSWLGI